MPRTSGRVGLIKSSAIRQIIARLAEAGRRENVISFGGGAPSLSPPKEVLEAAAKDLVENPRSVKYDTTAGLIELREKICEDLRKYSGASYDPKTEVVLTDGATEAILLLTHTLVDKEDEVILMDPTYLGYTNPVTLAGGRTKSVPVYVEDGFQPSIEALKEAITDKTKVLTLLSPDNPTGRIIERKLAKAIVDLAVDHDFWVISDEAYRHIVYNGQHIRMATLDNAREHVVTACTFSKEASMPGLRLGFVYGPKEPIAACEKLKQVTSLCPNTFSQIVAIHYLEGDTKERYLREIVIPTYKKRRDAMHEAIKENVPKARTVKPEGSFFFFVDMRPYLRGLGMSSAEFSDYLFKEAEVVVIPGEGFGENGRGHVRMTFVSESEEKISEGMLRMGNFIEERVSAKLHAR